MASANTWEPAYIQNVQAQYAQLFQMAMKMGLGVVGLQMGSNMVNFYYDKVRKHWKPGEPGDVPALQDGPQSSSSQSAGDLRSTRRALGFQEIEPIPDSEQQRQQQQPEPPQPPQQFGKVVQQRLRIEVGQQMVPVDDYNDYNHDNYDDDHDPTIDKEIPDQTEHQKYLAHVHGGKNSNCNLWNNDPWKAKRQQLMETVVQVQKQVSDLTAANTKTANYNNTAEAIQTPMMKSIATPITLVQQDYDVIDFNNVMNAKGVDGTSTTTINNGAIRRPKRSPNTDPSSEYGDIGHNTLYLNNVGIGSGNKGNGGGDDDLGDGSNGSGKGAMARGHGYGNKRIGFTLVKSSNIAISTFSGSNLSTQPYLLFHKTIKRLIYIQGDDGELLFDIPTQVENCGAQPFGSAQLTELARQCTKAGKFNRAPMSVLLNYTTQGSTIKTTATQNHHV